VNQIGWGAILMRFTTHEMTVSHKGCGQEPAAAFDLIADLSRIPDLTAE